MFLCMEHEYRDLWSFKKNIYIVFTFIFYLKKIFLRYSKNPQNNITIEESKVHLRLQYNSNAPARNGIREVCLRLGC